MSDWIDPFTCPVCETDNCVPIAGPPSSPIFILGEAPGRDELIKGVPFVGGAGELLRKELAYLRFDLKACRLGNLWLHEPNKNDECFEHGLQRVLKEAQGKKAMLLIGSDTVKYFTGYNVSDVNGLQVQSELLSVPLVYAMFQPAVAFHGPVGEVRLGLRNFVKAVEGIL